MITTSRMSWVQEINGEFRDILLKGRNQGKVLLTEDEIRRAELSFLPYYNMRNEKNILISPPLSVITNISEDLYEEIKKIYPKYTEQIRSKYNMNVGNPR
jgi:hypothetical protein